ncbi:MAG TPA: c-type cytochrome [Thiobacillaceae bacterium]|nr:c-type cytochrome [Thiobacillaceae bacterium]
MSHDMRIIPLLSLIFGVLMLSACSTESRTPSESVSSLTAAEIQFCESCHYVNGTSKGPEFPKIAGQYDVYLVQAVENFKQGRRDSETMQRIASLHTEGEMKKLARYFAEQKPDESPSISVPDPVLWARGKNIFEKDRVYGIACANCHGYDGMGYAYESPQMRNVRAIPRLAGQSYVYLASALQKYVEGENLYGFCTMRKAGRTLAKDDVKALVEYLSSLAPGAGRG